MNIPRSFAWMLGLLTPLLLAGCGYNDFQRLDEQVKAARAEVLNEYPRRADLIPNTCRSRSSRCSARSADDATKMRILRGG